MLILGFIKYIWSDIFNDLKTTGKIVFLLFFVLATISLICFGVVELIAIDVWIILLEYFKKDSDVKGMIQYLINW